MRLENLAADRAWEGDLGAASLCAKEFGYSGPWGDVKGTLKMRVT